MEKAPDAFRTISEVADDLDIPQHVLRFWESRFSHIKPMKRAGGRRYYRPDDVDLLRGIRHLLYGQGYTIRGVQRILKEQGPRFVQSIWQQPPEGAEEIRVSEPGIGDMFRQGDARQDDSYQADFQQDDEPDAPEMERSAPMRSAPSDELDPEIADDPEPPTTPYDSVPMTPPQRVYALTDDDTGRLQSVLQELAECRRLLDEAMQIETMQDGTLQDEAR